MSREVLIWWIVGSFIFTMALCCSAKKKVDK